MAARMLSILKRSYRSGTTEKIKKQTKRISKIGFSIETLFLLEVSIKRCQIRIQREILRILTGSNREKLDGHEYFSYKHVLDGSNDAGTHLEL